MQSGFEQCFLIPKRFLLDDVMLLLWTVALRFSLLASMLTGSEEMSSVGRPLHQVCHVCLQLMPRVAKSVFIL